MCRVLRTRLGCQIDCISSTEQFELAAINYAMVLIDWSSGKHPLELCRLLRSRHLSINIMVLLTVATKKGIAAALDAGADDCVTCNTAPPELVARTRALLRRSQRPPALPTGRADLRGSLIFDRETREVSGRGAVVDLTRTQAKILALLSETTVPASAAALATALFNRNDPAAVNLIHKHLSNTQAKLRTLNGGIDVIQRRAAGYVLRAAVIGSERIEGPPSAALDLSL